MSIFDQLRRNIDENTGGLYSKGSKFWRSHGKLGWTALFAPIDIAASENKIAAVLGNVADVATFLAFRGSVKSPWGLAAISLGAYAAGRGLGYAITGQTPTGAEGAGLKAKVAEVALENKQGGYDDPYNTIEGLPHQGMAGAMRSTNTDFGSGYQGDETSNSVLGSIAFLGGGVLGGSLAYGSWKSTINANGARYPRLEAMRKAGRRGGFMMWDPREAISQAMSRATNLPDMIFKNIMKTYHPTASVKDLRGFSGLLYIRDEEIGINRLKSAIKKGALGDAYISGMGNWDIGMDKLATYEWLADRGLGKSQAFTVPAEDFIGANKRFHISKFADFVGGPENIVVKSREGALSEEVWLGLKNIPKESLRDIQANPADYLMQKRLDLADEFRVVTVGDKPIYSAYRWGSPASREGVSRLGDKFSQVSDFIAKERMLENTIPIGDQTLRSRVESFASGLSKELPYDIGAFDVGLTKQGDLKLIEAQRFFGTSKHPLVAERIVQEVTGKVGPIGKTVIGGSILLGAGLAYGAYSLLTPDRNDAYNPIKGHDAGHWGRETTFASGDFEPGSSWKGEVVKFAGAVGKKITGLFARNAIKEAEIVESIVGKAVGFDVAAKGNVGKFAGLTEREFGVEFMRQESRDFPKEFFNVASGKTMALDVAGETLTQPMVAHPDMLDNLTGLRGQIYKGSIVHETLEAALASKGAKMFHGHFSRDVMSGHGMFLGAIDVPWRDIKGIYRGRARAEMRVFKRGWKRGQKMLKTNKPFMGIKGHDAGRWGREANAARSDFDPGQSKLSVAEEMFSMITAKGMAAGVKTAKELEYLMGTVEKLVPSGRAVLKGSTPKDLAKFAGEAGAELAADTAAWGKKFRPGFGKTTTTTKEPMAMVPDPVALEAKGFDMNKPINKIRHMGSAVHEPAEAFTISSGAFDPLYAKMFGHGSPLPPVAQGWFYQGLGVKQSQLSKLASAQDLALMEQGYKTRQAVSQTMAELRKQAEIARRVAIAKRAGQQGLQEAATKANFVADKQKVGCKGVERPKRNRPY